MLNELKLTWEEFLQPDEFELACCSPDWPDAAEQHQSGVTIDIGDVPAAPEVTAEEPEEIPTDEQALRGLATFIKWNKARGGVSQHTPLSMAPARARRAARQQQQQRQQQTVQVSLTAFFPASAARARSVQRL